MRRRATVTLVLVSLLAFGAGPSATASPGSNLRIDLEGSPLAAAAASGYYCHDFAYPQIHCFRSAAKLRNSLELTGQTFGTLSAPAGTWVTLFRDATYAGTFAYLSHDYDKLGDIGWNDMVSSFRVEVGLSGHFSQNVFGAGWAYTWCCYDMIPYVGSSYNDQFSSFYHN